MSAGNIMDLVKKAHEELEKGGFRFMHSSTSRDSLVFGYQNDAGISTVSKFADKFNKGFRQYGLHAWEGDRWRMFVASDHSSGFVAAYEQRYGR